MSSLFSLSFEYSRANELVSQLFVLLKNSRMVRSWNSPFDGFVLVVSASNTEELSAMFAEFFGDSVPCMVSRLEKHQNFGVLPELSWDWIEKTRHELNLNIAPELPT